MSPPAQPAAAPLEQAVEREKLLMLEHAVWRAVIFTGAMVSVLAWAHRDVAPHAVLITWVVLMWTTLLVRFAYAQYRLRHLPPPGKERAWRNFAIYHTLTVSVTNGVFTWLVFDPDYLMGMLLTVMIVVVAHGAVAATTTVLRPMFFLLLGVHAAAVAALCFWQGGEFFNVLGAVVCAFAFVMTVIHLANARSVERQIRLQLQNAQLAARLSAEAESARQANTAKGRFLAAASHDLRQPAHALALFLGALDRARLEPAQRAILEKVQHAAEGLRQMLDGLLDLAQAESGRIEPRPRSIPAQRVLDVLERDFAPLAEDKGLVWRSVPTQRWLHADEDLVLRMLRNLAANAVRCTERGGILIGMRRRGDHLSVEVWDTGVGIAPQEQALVFDEFYQVAGRTARGGLGLGLPIVARLAQAHGTRVELRSRPGRGSVFRFALAEALPPVQEAAGTPPRAATASLDGRRILVIEDDAQVGDAVQTLLRAQGATVAVHVDAASALEALDPGRPPDAVIADYRLGAGATGLEVALLLRRAAGAELPVVLVSGDVTAGELEAVAQAGLRFLRKPVESGLLASTLQQVMAAR